MPGALPDKVTICGVEWSVKTREMDGKFGHCDTTRLELVIDSTAAEQRQKKTLMHEIMHAWAYENGLDNWADEKLITALETHMYDLLRDNDFSWVRPPQPPQSNATQ